MNNSVQPISKKQAEKENAPGHFDRKRPIIYQIFWNVTHQSFVVNFIIDVKN